MTDYARAALLAVVEHWPGRLDDLTLCGHAEARRPGLAGVNVWRGDRGLLLSLPHHELNAAPPHLARVAEIVTRAAYRRWHTEPPEPDLTPDHPRAALLQLVEHWPGDLGGVRLTASLMRSAAAGVLVQDGDRALQVGFTRAQLDALAPAAASALHVELAYRAWVSADWPGPQNPPYAE